MRVREVNNGPWRIRFFIDWDSDIVRRGSRSGTEGHRPWRKRRNRRRKEAGLERNRRERCYNGAVYRRERGRGSKQGLSRERKVKERFKREVGKVHDGRSSPTARGEWVDQSGFNVIPSCSGHPRSIIRILASTASSWKISGPPKTKKRSPRPRKNSLTIRTNRMLPSIPVIDDGSKQCKRFYSAGPVVPGTPLPPVSYDIFAGKARSCASCKADPSSGPASPALSPVSLDGLVRRMHATNA